MLSADSRQPLIKVVACWFVVSSVGCASGASDDFNNRFYVGAGAVASQLSPDTDNVAGVSLDDDQGTGFSATLGYDLSDRFAVEGYVSDLGAATLSPAGEIEYQSGAVAGVLYGLNDYRDRIRREGFSVFGKLGVGALRNSATSVEIDQLNGTHVLAGIGVEYGFYNGVAARVALVSHDTDVQFGQLSVLYRFGGGDYANELTIVDATVEKPEPSATSGASKDPTRTERVRPVPSTTTSSSNTGRDLDADGVADTVDNCPGTSSLTPVDASGCDLFSGVIEGVQFEPASDRLTDSATEALDDVVDALNQYPDARIAVEAHTDNQGAAEANMQLSKQRALSVAQYLVSQGIAGDRLAPRAFGESRPRVSNATSTGRAANRRVEFQLLR